MTQHFDQLFDASGLNCPMPLVNARKAIGNLGVGEVLKVVATDRGSIADFQGWATIAKNIELVTQDTEEAGGKPVYVHYMKRTA